MTQDLDPVRWFEELGECAGRGCKRPAIGTLRGPRNESYGHYCRPCATRRLERARKARMREQKLAPVVGLTAAKAPRDRD